VEDHESLHTGTVVGELADAIEDEVDDLLSNGVVTTGVVIRGILLSGDQLLGVVQLAVGTSADLVHNSGLKINHDATGHELTGSGLREEGLVRIIRHNIILLGVGWLLSVGLDTVLEAEKLPASVTDLATGLPEVNKKAFAHFV